jgi:hypothetical protein
MKIYARNKLFFDKYLGNKGEIVVNVTILTLMKGKWQNTRKKFLKEESEWGSVCWFTLVRP